MLLRRLHLQNIRSYIDETITFPEGSTLLSGDIGSGKSTILLAIEFALFGASRPDLSAESLLRKGASKGLVELTFFLRGQEVTIQRNLKKEKDALKQMPGYITINSLKKELMPVELKAEMLSLLGYPESLLTKNKNYIFRYTVYTPQEEMKLILQENNEIRLDVLRKIFNIDKYGIIRENLQVYLKKLRSELLVMNTKTEALPEYRGQFQQLNKEKEETEKSIRQILPQQKALQEEHKKQKQELESLELQQKKFIDLQQELKTTFLLLEEKKKRIEQLETKKKHILQEISAFPSAVEKSAEQLRTELLQAEEHKNSYLTHKTTLETRTKHLQDLTARMQEEIAEIARDIAPSDETERVKAEIIAAIEQKKELLDQKKELDEVMEKNSDLLARNKTLLAQAVGVQETIRSLENCPTCLQPVSEGHKHKIISQEEAKIIRARQLLEEMQEKKAEIAAKKEAIEKKLVDIVSHEKLLPRINYELQQAQKKKELLAQKKERLHAAIRENDSLAKQLQEFLQQWNINDLLNEIKEKQEILQRCSHKMMLEKNAADIFMQLEEESQKRKELLKKRTFLEETLKGKEDPTLKVTEKKELISTLLEDEKEIAVKMAQAQTRLESMKRHGQEIQERIELLTREKEKAVRLQELYYWLEEHFLSLTYTIEKQVMVAIHRHFNQLFQEWFAVLINDENISSCLDDSFAPLITQNGYEISFADLSGGEKTSAALAYRLALNKVINDAIHTINTKELLILDEPTDGFSSEQLDKVREVLDKLNLQQSIIVSHESKIESFVENIIKIQKEGHVSSVMI